ncbi:MAG: hypothetical protein HQL54_05330 [Magnetococcales bacterium]|nr:hypothetical protein [Magnetococcales bacterium]
MALKKGIQEGFCEASFQNRINVMEGLIGKIVELHVASTQRFQELDAKLDRMERIAQQISASSGTMVDQTGKSPAIGAGGALAGSSGDATVQALDARLKNIEKLTAIMHTRLTGNAEPITGEDDGIAAVTGSGDAIPADVLVKMSSDQSTLIEELKKRIDPRLVIYLEPLIKTIEEEGLAAEKLKTTSISRLSALLDTEEPPSDQMIYETLVNIGTEIKDFEKSFDKTHQELKIIAVPFQKIGEIFKGNLDNMIQAHDMIFRLSADLPQILEQMVSVYNERIQKDGTG